jgi:hypothetical protein
MERKMARIGAHLSRIHLWTSEVPPPADCAKASKQSPRRNRVRSLLFQSLTRHVFTGKYAQRFHMGRAPSACGCGFGLHTVNHAVFDCSRYTTTRLGSPHFDLDFRTGRPNQVSVWDATGWRQHRRITPFFRSYECLF